MKAEIQLEDKVQKPKEKPITNSYHKWVFLVIGCIAIILILGYGLLTYYSQNSTLPLIKYQGQDLGLKSFSEVTKIVLASDKQVKSTNVILAFNGKQVTKPLGDFGFTVQSSKTADSIFNFGKKNVYLSLPDLAYFKNILTSQSNVPITLRYSSTTEKNLNDSFTDLKKDPADPTIGLDKSGNLTINSESTGTKVDLNDLTNKLQSELNGRLSGPIQLNKISTKSNFTAGDLEVFQSDIQGFINKSISLQSDYKKLTIKKEDLLGFVDLQRTVLNQKLTLSDQSMTNYLNTAAAKSFNITGKKREISSIDNSVISEGTEGKQIDVPKSLENIKNTLTNNNKTAEVVVATAPIQEEVISPGYNPGKYPGKYIEVNLTQQMFYTFDGTQLINSYQVSTGKWSMPTPVGEYSINDKNPMAYSSEFGLYMPFWMPFIGSQYGIHELPVWPDGRQEGENHLGTPVSHGCIRLGRGPAEEVYNWAEVGTPVFIHK